MFFVKYGIPNPIVGANGALILAEIWGKFSGEAEDKVEHKKIYFKV